MANFTFMHTFTNITIAKKLYSVVGIMAVLLAVQLGTLYFAVTTLSSVRAFVGSEGLWSKAQKDASYYLVKYSQTRSADDLHTFNNAMKVPLGYHKTLAELLKENPDLEYARQGALEGGTHPDDIDGMFKLFRSFDEISYIKKSIRIWAKADATVGELNVIAKKLQLEVHSSSPSKLNVDAIIKDLDSINRELAVLENDFSATLGQGARWFEDLILNLLIFIALTVGICGLVLTYLIVSGMTKGLTEISSASKRVAKRDFSARAKVFSKDEIGVLAESFNAMTEELSENIQKHIKVTQDLAVQNSFREESDRRIGNIMEALIRTTQLDFSQKLDISDKADELDAIAIGLNTMSEELEFHLEQSQLYAEKLNVAQQLAEIGSWEWDVIHNRIEWSDELYRLYGVKRENFETTYENYLLSIHPEDRDYVNEMIQIAYQNHQPFDFFHRLIRKDSEVLTIHSRGEVLLSVEGEISKMIGTAQNVTERKEIERKLKQYNIELERKNHEIEQFAYAAAHDLQEPLRSISNFTKLLGEKLEGSTDEEITTYMKLVQRGANRMSRLIFDLLEYSRVGRSLVTSSLDCNKLIAEILTDLNALIEESGAEIYVENLPTVAGYELKSVFQNLIINAIKFRKVGIAPILNISATDTGSEFLFIFKDNGIGIEKEYFERIFVIFQRLHLKTQYEGTGIGLSLTKKIIEMHGGKIWIESEFGKGSTFYFTIPKTLI